MTQPTNDLENVLNAVVLEEQAPNYDALLRWCKRYPKYQKELTRFFATWAIQMELSGDTPVDESRLANLGVSRALNLLNQQAKEPPKASTSGSKATRLLVACMGAGVSREELAGRTELDVSIIDKLDLRRLTNVPTICAERIAEVLHERTEYVQPLITGPPVVERGVRYKSAKRPGATVEDFTAAVRSSSLSKPQQDFWLRAASKQEPENR
jgi:hypothetical protein